MNGKSFFAEVWKWAFPVLLAGVLVLVPPVVESQRLDTSERYRGILQSLSQKNITGALTESYPFLAQTDGYEQLYDKLALTAKTTQQLPQVREMFLALLQQTPPQHRAYYGLGLIFNAEGNLPEAIESFKTCFRLMPEFAAPLIALVDICRDSKNDAVAESYLKSLVLSAPESYAAHLGLGYYHARKRQVEQALVELDAVERLHPNLSALCYNKALALQLGGRYSDSAAELTRCQPLIEAQANEEEQQAFLNITGINHYQLGDYSQAVSTFRAAIELARKLGDKGYEEVSLAYYASIDEARDRYESALEGYKKAFETAQQSVSPKSSTNLRRYPGRIGSVYFALGDWELANQYFQTGLNIARQTGDKGLEGLLLTYLGDLYTAQQELTLATDYYQQVVNLGIEDPFSPGSAPDVLSQLLLQQGKHAQAELLITTELQAARKTSQYAKQIKLLNRLGDLQFQLNQPMAAIETYQKAIDIAFARNSVRQTWIALAGSAACYVKLGQIEKARVLYLQALEKLESVRGQLRLSEDKSGFLQDKVEIYKKLLGILVKLGKEDNQHNRIKEAFHIAERSRTRAFSDLLAEAKVNLEQSLDASLLKQQQPLQQAVSATNAKLLKARAAPPEQQDKTEIQKLESDLGESDRKLADWWREQNSRYADLKYPEPVDLPQTQRLLSPDQVMLAYSLGAEESYLFAVSREGYQVWTLPAEEQLGKQAGKLLAALTDERAETSVWQEAAAELYKELIQPAAKFLRQRPATRELIILPDGALHRVPFEVLLEPMPRPTTDSIKLPYLVKRYALSYAPSATALKSLKEAPQNPARKPKEVIVFADPQYDQTAAQPSPAIALLRAAGGEQLWKFKQLSNSAREAQGIAQVFAAKGGAELFLGNQANEAEVKSPNDRLLGYRVVHFSAHGLVNERRPRFSGLVLTLPPATRTDDAPTGDDGILSAYEIFNLKLNAELVTLSACETGLGKEVKGEGLMSLARGFMYAGTPSVLASLWKVDDTGTANLMIDFYRFWQQGKRTGNRVVKLNKAEALREAQLKAIAAGSQPFYWAPFVLVGRSN